LSNVAVSYAAYIRDMLWPTKLEAFYPYPQSIPVWWVLGSLLVLLGVSIGVIRAAREYPYLAVGWLWYLGTLVPVVGIIQSGLQSRADRFGYIPLIGLFILIAWGIPDLLGRVRNANILLGVAAGVAVLACTLIARRQVGSWENSLALWTHAVAVDPENYRAQGLLGLALVEHGELDQAVTHYNEALRYSKALRLKPDIAEVHYALGNIFVDQGKFAEAFEEYTEAIRTNPKFAQAHNNLGNLLSRQKKLDQAALEYRDALRIDPNYAEAHTGLGAVLADQGKRSDAIAQYSEALRIDPDSAPAHNNLGTALAEQGDLDQAVHEFLEALRVKPDASIQFNVGFILSQQGKIEDATRHLEAALQLDPNNRKAQLALDELKKQSSKSQ